MGKRIDEGLWDCAQCNRKGIRGGLRNCPGCGKPRDEHTEFYMPGTPRPVSSKEAQKIDRRPDWCCNFCRALNPASIDECISCGAKRTADNPDYFQLHSVKSSAVPVETPISKDANSYNEPEPKETEIPRTHEHFSESVHNDSEDSSNVHEPGTESIEIPEPITERIIETPADTESESLDSFERDVQLSEKVAMVFSNIGKAFCIAGEAVMAFFECFGKLILAIGGGILFIILCILAFKPKYEATTIDNMSWNRTMKIERFQTVEESDWSLPAGARLQKKQEEYYKTVQEFDKYEERSREVQKERLVGYEEVVVGYRDLGNGYFEEETSKEPIYETYWETEYYKEPVYRDVKVYKTKYYYEIDKWLYERTMSTSCFDNNPYWPDTSSLAEDERVGSQSETYTIYFKTRDGEDKHIELDYGKWSGYKIGDEIVIKRYLFGLVTKIEY